MSDADDDNDNENYPQQPTSPVEPPSWANGASLSSGSSTDKYAAYIQMVRNNISKDSIKRQMMVAGMTQREIIAFFKAYPVGGGQKSTNNPVDAVKLAPPLKIEKKTDTNKVSLPKPRQAGAKPLRISPARSPAKKAESKRGGLFSLGSSSSSTTTASPSKTKPKPQSAASKNAKYFAELAKVCSSFL
jgi:hypothetical protein